MAENISIKISAILSKNAEKDLQTQLNIIAKKLKLTIDNVNVVNQKTKDSSNLTESTTKNASKAVSEYEKQLNQLIHTYKMKEISDRTFLDSMEKIRNKSEFSELSLKKQEQVVSLLAQAEKNYQKVVDSGLTTRNKYINQLEKNKLAQKDLLNTIRGLRGKDGAFIVDDNLKKLNKLETTIRNLNPNTKDFAKNLRFAKSELKAITTTTNIYKKEVQDANKYTNIFGQSILSAGKKFASWLMIGNVIVSAINSVKFGINTIIELDTAITDLKKVSDEIGTSVGIREFLTDVNELAIKVGHSTNAAIKSVTDFKKLGYSLTESKALAEQALIYSNISDQSIEDATKSLISTLKGFQLGVEDVNRVMDAYNEVGNNFSITSAGIGAALQRSASSLFEANNTLEESIGLIVAANASIQNPEKVGNGLKTVSMRIRGIADESGEAYPQLDKLIKKITGVDIMEDENTFKSTYDIMVEISKVWKDITDKDRATLLEAMFGKHQGAVGASLLNNMAEGIKATETALNSFGSSAREQAVYMESIDARINKLTESTVKLWNNTINTDFVKGVVDFSTVIINLVDKIGLLNIALSGAILYLGIFKKELFMTPLISALTSSFSGLTLGLNGATTAMLGLNAATKLFAPLAIASGVVALIAAFDKFTVSIKEQKKEIASLTSELSGLQTELDQLKSKENRTEQEEKYLKILIEQEKNLKRQLALKTKLLVEEEYMPKDNDFDPATDDMLIGYFDKDTNKVEEAINNIKKYNEEIENLDINNKNAKQTFDELNLKITEQKNILAEQYKVIKDRMKALEEGDEKDTEHYKTLVVLLNAIEKVINKTEESTDAKTKNNRETKTQLSDLKDLQSEIEKYASSMELLNKAEKELNTENELSSAILSELIEKYPEIIEQTGLQKDKILELITAKKQESASFIEEEKRKTNELIDQVQKRLEVYQKELEKIDSVYSAVWLTHVESGAMSEQEYQKRLSLSKGLLGTTISRDKAELDRLRNRLSSLDYIQNNLGRIDSTTSTSSPASPYESKLDDYINTLQLIEEKQQEINETQKQRDLAPDEKKIELIQKEIVLQQDLIKLNEQLLSQQQQTRQSLADQLSAYSDVVTVADDLRTLSVDTDKYNKLTDKQKENLDNLISSFTNLNKSINSSKNAMVDAQVSIKNLNDEMTKQANSVADKVIDIYKKMYEQQKQSKLKTIELEMDAEERRHKRVLDNLQEELDEFEDYINRKLKLLDREANTEDFNKQLSDLQGERDEIRQQIDVLSLDDSVEARARVFELNKQLADKEEEIEKIKTDRIRDLRRNNLQDELEGYRKEIEEKQNAENKKYEAIKNRLQRERESTIAYYDNLINDERKYAQIREEIISGHLDTVLNDLGIFAEVANSKLRNVSESIKNNLLDTIRAVKTELNSLSSSIYSSGYSGSSTNIHADYINKTYSGGISAYNADLDRRLKEAQNNRDYDLMQRIIKEKQRIGTLHDGGIIGGKSDRLTEAINKLFNVKPNEQLIKGLKGELYIPPQNIVKNFIPNINKLMTSTSSPNGGNVVYNLNLRFDNFRGTKKDGENVFNIVANGLKRMGKK